MPVDARSRSSYTGWIIYRSSGYAATLDDINTELEHRDLKSIKERTYDHYNRLRRHGFQQYVTINQFDVQQLRNPVWTAAIRRRYRLRSAQASAILTLVPLDAEPFVVAGVVTALSEAQAVFSAEVADGKALENVKGVLSIGSEQWSVEVEVAVPDASVAQQYVFELSVLGQLDVQEVLGTPELSSGELAISMDRRESESLAETVRGVYLLFQVVDAARLVCDSLIDEEWQPQTVGIPAVRGLAKTNPVEVVIAGSVPLLGFVYGLVKIWNSFRLGEANANFVQADANIRQAHASLINERVQALRINNELRQRSADAVTRNQLRALASHQLNSASLARRPQAPSNSSEPDPIDSLIGDELVPSLNELYGPDVREINVETRGFTASGDPSADS
jgi:hypothetical protein